MAAVASVEALSQRMSSKSPNVWASSESTAAPRWRSPFQTGRPMLTLGSGGHGDKGADLMVVCAYALQAEMVPGESIPPASRAGIEAVIRRILVSELGADAALLSRSGSDTPLLGRGLSLDSMEALALVTALEAEFSFQADDADLTVALFATLGTLADYVARKRDDGARG
jgi:acyl carrier protein